MQPDRLHAEDGNYSLSVVVPVYNEEQVLPEFHRRLVKTLDELNVPAEFLYVNDGSKDRTLEILIELHTQDPRTGVINLSRNFGKETALTAGLDRAVGDATIVIDADLQDPPELIPALVSKWQEGFDVVYAKRITREGETALKRMTAKIFYRVIRRMSRVYIPEDVGDFRLLDRRALDALLRLRERHRFMKGLFSWIGFRQTAISYRRDPRFAGESKWNYWKLWNFALEGITSFTIAPLLAAAYFGVLVALAAFGFASFIIYRTLVYGDPVQGYPSLVVIVLFLGGIQLMFLGVIGEYLGRIFNETKQRPLYFTADSLSSSLQRMASPSLDKSELEHRSSLFKGASSKLTSREKSN